MPSPEPNKEMEDLLKAYAMKRREQGRQELPSELRAASREMLQHEVRRTFGDGRPQAAGVPGWRWLASHWLRLALGGALAALLILVVVRSAPPVATRTTAPGSAVSGTLTANIPFKKLGQQFVQLNSRMRTQNGAPAPVSVLATFQLERQGRNVIVFDGDGSVYKGRVLEPAVADKVDRSKDQGVLYSGANRAGNDFDDTANYSFEVSGMNKDLKQNVVFTGNVLQMPQPVTKTAAAARGQAGGGGAPLTLGQQPVQSQLAGRSRTEGAEPPRSSTLSNQIQAGALQDQTPQFLRITGKVQVEGGGEFEIEAQPPGP
jgi:hypothetical protein